MREANWNISGLIAGHYYMWNVRDYCEKPDKSTDDRLEHFLRINLQTMKFNKIRVSAAQIHLLHDVSSVTIGIDIQHILQASYY